MIASSHAPFAAALVVATRTENIGLAIAIGLVSHVILDAVAHTDYCQFRKNRESTKPSEAWELPVFAADFLLAAGIGTWLAVAGHSWAIFWAAVFAVAPDLVWEPRIERILFRIPGVRWYTEVPHTRLHRRVSYKARYWGIIPQIMVVIMSSWFVLAQCAQLPR